MASAPLIPAAQIAKDNAGNYKAGMTPQQIQASRGQAGMTPGQQAMQTPSQTGPGSTQVSVSAPKPISVSDMNSSASALNVGGYKASSLPSIQGILQNYSQPSAGETAATNAENQTLNAMGSVESQLGQQSAYQQQLLSAPGGVYSLQNTLNNVNNLINQYSSQAGQQKLAADNRLAPEFSILGQQDAIQRDLSSKLLGLSASASALNNEISLANSRVQMAVQAKFQPLQNELDYYKQVLSVNQNQLSYAQKQKAQILQGQLAEANTMLQAQIKNKQDAMTQVLQYAPIVGSLQNGAQIMDQMQNATNPAEVAAIAAQYGVGLPQSKRYSDVVTTDAFGNQVQHVFDTLTGRFVNGAPSSANQMNASSQYSVTTPAGGGGYSASSSASPSANQGPQVQGNAASNPETPNKYGISYSQYGLLANTNFNPNAAGQAGEVDQLAYQYLTYYLNNGKIPTPSELGRSIKPGAIAQISQRANTLFQQATGEPLDAFKPSILSNNYKLINENNNLLNKLKVQEGTIESNFGLNLQNLQKNNVNKYIPIVNSVLNNVFTALGNAGTAQAQAQSATLQNELGSLLSVKNDGGTTVADKAMAGDLLPSNLSVGQLKDVLGTLMQEGRNSIQAVENANTQLYQQSDPLMLDPQNPNRTKAINSATVNRALSKQGLSYNAVIDHLQQLQKADPQQYGGMIPVLNPKTGQVGFGTQAELNSGSVVPL